MKDAQSKLWKGKEKKGKENMSRVMESFVRAKIGKKSLRFYSPSQSPERRKILLAFLKDNNLFLKVFFREKTSV